ncbi:hypothetical protein SAMN05216226_1237 [Halovenus aranensis]|uniref:Uncharacterized protein n=2 Tax=Halovenus aranensis TaxID=890420 RepID=A0A1G8ZHE5_9EURY|nr:hypothetical protein SAMN05216226_1237 [Halovenus aranensis]
MADLSLVSELTQTDHDTAGIQMLTSSHPLEGPITGVETTEIKRSRLDEEVYRVGITGRIHNRSPGNVKLSLSDTVSLGIADTSEGVTFLLHTNDDDIPLHPNKFIAGKQNLSLELPESTALADIDSSGLTLDLVESDYLDEPYYKVSLIGFVVEASSTDINLTTTDGQEFRLKARMHENGAIAHIEPSEEPEFEAIRALDSGLPFPE